MAGHFFLSLELTLGHYFFSKIDCLHFSFIKTDFTFSFIRIDFIVHGDDPCLVDGKDVYEAAKMLGGLKDNILRKELLSLTGYMLLEYAMLMC